VLLRFVHEWILTVVKVENEGKNRLGIIVNFADAMRTKVYPAQWPLDGSNTPC